MSQAIDTSKPGGRYHHGDLKAALLTATDAILEEDGIDALSLRACARRAGVSHAAPAHHFGDLAGLLSVYAAGVFADLQQTLEACNDDTVTDAFARLHTASLTYIRFAQSRPGAYRLMFRCDILNPEHPELKTAAHTCYGLLLDNVSRLTPGGDESTIQTRAVLVWSLLHGFVSLVLDGHFARVAPPGMATGQEQWLAEQITLAIKPIFGGNQ